MPNINNIVCVNDQIVKQVDNVDDLGHSIPIVNDDSVVNAAKNGFC